MAGLAVKGWAPAVNFWMDNSVVIGAPPKGVFVFYDKNQLRSGAKFQDIQRSIDQNPNFVRDFRRRTDEIFGAVFFKCLAIEEANVSLLSNKELYELWRSWLDAVMVAPIITVQLWGIEACWDENWRIMKFLKKRLRELRKTDQLQFYKETLSVNRGETVPFTEQKDFYRVASVLAKPKIIKLFHNKDPRTTSRDLTKFTKENELFERHIKKYAWVNMEYVSGGWSREKWLELFRTALLDKVPPRQKLKELLINFQALLEKRQQVIEELRPPKDVLHAINALAEFIAQRDWTKGYFAKSLLAYHKLLDEVAKRIGINRREILQYSYIELGEYFRNGTILPRQELQNRTKNGFALVIKHGKLRLIIRKKSIQRVIQKEGVSEPFESIAALSSFRGLAASRGIVIGRARVLDDASQLASFQDGEILVTYMTTIEFTPLFRKAIAVVTDEGGMSSHAAIVSREFRLPCVVGTKVATRVVQTGDTLEVDGSSGMVKILR